MSPGYQTCTRIGASSQTALAQVLGASELAGRFCNTRRKISSKTSSARSLALPTSRLGKWKVFRWVKVDLGEGRLGHFNAEEPRGSSACREISFVLSLRSYGRLDLTRYDLTKR